MSAKHEWVVRFYHRILNLYPSHFRQEYQEEMLTVFELQVAGLNPESLRGLIKICGRELRDLPGALAGAYLRERRYHPMDSNLHRWFSPSHGSWKELLLASLPYLLMGFLPGFLSLFPQTYQTVNIPGLIALIVLGLLLIVVGIIGLVVRFPRWSMIYAGILLTLITFGILIVLINLKIIPTPGWNSYLVTAIFLCIFLVALFLGAGLAIWISGRLAPIAEFRNQIMADPTLLSLMMYGGGLVIVLANFEDVSGENWYLMLAAIAMILGAGGFLYSGSRRTRMRSLFWGITIAMALTLGANLFLVDYGLPPAFYIGSFPVERTVIFISLTWATTLVMIWLPGLIRFPGMEKSLSGNQE